MACLSASSVSSSRCTARGRSSGLKILQRRCASAQGTTQQTSQITLNTGSDCKLAVAFYPMFSYDASDGAVSGTAVPGEHGRTMITFDPEETYIPPLDWKSTRVLGMPIPPPLRIDIKTKQLQGWLDKNTGQAELTFDALFIFTASSLYRPPALEVKTVLSTESVQGKFQEAEGARFKEIEDSALQGKLVGIAQVAKTGDWLLDTFLQLPSEAFALLTAELQGL